MITYANITAELPLERFMEDATQLTFYSGRVEQTFFHDVCRIWKQQNYWAFLLCMGPLVELVGYIVIDAAKIRLYQVAGKEHVLKKTSHGFIASEREKHDTFQRLVDAVKAKKVKFVKSDFDNGQWSAPQSLNFAVKYAIDEIARYRLITNLEGIQKLRNSVGHGNLMQFVHQFPGAKGGIVPVRMASLTTGDTTEEVLPLEQTSPTFVLIALSSAFKNDSSVKSTIAKLFVETTYILSVLMKQIESDEFIQQILKKMI